MIITFGIFGLVLVLASFATWWHPTKLGFKRTSDELKPLRGIFLGLWGLAVPLYSVLEWFSLKQLPSNLVVFQYEHKLLSDLWTAFGVMLGLLFGVRR
jgi:hypothetical protein